MLKSKKNTKTSNRYFFWSEVTTTVREESVAKDLANTEEDVIHGVGGNKPEKNVTQSGKGL